MKGTEMTSSLFKPLDSKTELGKFSPSDAAIAQMSEQYLAMHVSGVNDTAGCKAVHDARMIVKTKRVDVEKMRAALKAEALAYGRSVDSEAKRLTELLEPIEAHLAGQERIVTDEKERLLKAAASIAMLKKEAEDQAIRDAAEERLRVEREKIAAERAAFAVEQAERKAESDKLEAINAKARAELEAIANAQRQEAQRQDAERAKIAAEQKRITDAENARIYAIELEAACVAAAERSKIATEERLKLEAAQKAEKDQALEIERQRIEAARPDVEKINAFGRKLQELERPEVVGKQALKFLEAQFFRIGAISADFIHYETSKA